MESVLRWLIHDAGLPMPDLQVDVHSGGGLFVGRADFAWRDRMVLVEFDGDHHRERKTFVDDLRRQNGLVAAGWTILRFSSADVVGRPAYVIATIRRALR
jgi:very-short-patch-repair endonuclease